MAHAQFAVAESGAGAERRSMANAILFALVTLLVLAAFNAGLARIYSRPDLWRAVTPGALALVGAIAFAGVRYRDLNDLLHACTRATGAGVLAFLLMERPEITVAVPGAEGAGLYIRYAYWLALPCAALGVLRPAFIAPAAVYVISTRLLAKAVSGLPISTLDVRYMIDMALYLVGFGLLVVKLGPRLHPAWLGAAARQNEVVGVAIGLHLANYFWSGVAKLMIGPTPWYWAVHNKTYNQIAYALENGVLPLAQWPWLTEFAYQWMKAVYAPLNISILLVQLFAIACVFRSRWLRAGSLLFDALHLGIYIFGGLFFWPWVWNNLTVWWTSRRAALTLGTKVACVTTIALGAPFLMLNPAAWLAWFDVADARQVYFEAVTNDGRAVKAPSALFLTQSYTMAHFQGDDLEPPVHYPATLFGSSQSVKRNELSGKCVSPKDFYPPPTGTPKRERNHQLIIGRYLVAHHQKMLRREIEWNRLNYYFRLHHTPSNPYLYPEFNGLSLHDVMGYNLVIESVCHGIEHGRQRKRVVARTVEFYDVR